MCKVDPNEPPRTYSETEYNTLLADYQEYQRMTQAAMESALRDNERLDRELAKAREEIEKFKRKEPST